MRILLVEDDPMLGAAIVDSLKDAFYAVDWVYTGKQALSAAEGAVYDLILLDLNLPQVKGIQVLTTLRQQGNSTPVLIITARDEVETRIYGLDSGADDYLVKPFDIGELLARIRALLRRGQVEWCDKLSASGITLNLTHYTVTQLTQPEAITLSHKEFALLKTLLTMPGKIYTRRELEDKLYGWGEEVESNAIDYLIYVLRKKLGKTVIKNIRGAGWTIVP